MVSPTSDRFVSLMALDQYCRELRWLEPLRREELADALACLARGKRERAQSCPDASVLAQARQARDRLVLDHHRLVMSIVHRLFPSFHHLAFDDLLNEANTCLLARLDEYCDNPAWEGHPFSHFVASIVYKSLFTMLREQDRPIKLPSKVIAWLNRKHQMERQWEQQYHRPPTLSEVAAHLSVRPEVVVEVEAYDRYQQTESVQALLKEAEPEEEHDFRSVFDESEPDADALSEEAMETLQRAVQEVLTEQQRQIVTLRYRLDDRGSKKRAITLVADLLSLNVQNAAVAEHRALERLRHALSYGIVDGKVCCELRADYEVPYYTEPGAAAALGVSPSTLRRRVHAGLIPYFYREDQGPRRLYAKAVIERLAAEWQEQAA